MCCIIIDTATCLELNCSKFSIFLFHDSTVKTETSFYSVLICNSFYNHFAIFFLILEEQIHYTIIDANGKIYSQNMKLLSLQLVLNYHRILHTTLTRVGATLGPRQTRGGRRRKMQFTESRRAFRPTTANSANSANCVIPKRVVDRLSGRRRALGGAKYE